jgi:hypothetical protein
MSLLVDYLSIKDKKQIVGCNNFIEGADKINFLLS